MPFYLDQLPNTPEAIKALVAYPINRSAAAPQRTG
jgi:hypothetical protein